MEWPSRNVHQGGILHPAKATYSPETHQFLKVLMEESKLSMMQRKKVNYFLRNGEPLPTHCSWTRNRRSKMPEVTIRPGSSKKRSRDDIVSSGAYEREPFRATCSIVDREREKEKLANKMAYNKDIVVTKEKIMRKIESEEVKVDFNKFDQLVEDIKEREHWLKEMEELGQGDKYRVIIEQQIQNKVREMQKLETANGK